MSRWSSRAWKFRQLVQKCKGYRRSSVLLCSAWYVNVPDQTMVPQSRPFTLIFKT